MVKSISVALNGKITPGRRRGELVAASVGLLDTT